MNNTQFAMAVAHALSQVGKTGIVLTSEEVQAIHHVRRRDVSFLWLPTGFGKSICYPFFFILTVAL